MNHTLQKRLIGAQLLALLVTFAGEIFGIALLIEVGVGSFFLALFAFLAATTLSLIDGLSHTEGPDMLETNTDLRKH